VRISVCIATFNGEQYLKKQLASILTQLSTEDEIIISDDNSTDRTLEIVREFKDKRIKIMLNDKKGYVSNFENALNHAKGEYIFLSDQDDIWFQNKVEVCLENLKIYDLVVSDSVLIDSKDKIISNSFYIDRRAFKSRIGNLVKFSFLGCCLAFNSKILTKALPFPKNHKFCRHDNWLFLVAAFYFNYHVLDEQLIYYRRHANNVSSGALNANTSLGFKIKYRFYLIYSLFKRLRKS